MQEIAPPKPDPDRVGEIGQSVEGRPIAAHYFGSGPNPVLVLGGIHGTEKNSSECAAMLVEELKIKSPNVSVVVIPAANPDGLAVGTRANAHHVDLNRNFPAKNWGKTPRVLRVAGHEPASEPETRAFIALIERLKPRRILSIHSMQEPCNNYDGPAENLARLMSSKNGYVTKDTIGYPTPGSFGSWAGIDLQIPMITLELPQSMKGDLCWERNREAILAFIRGS
jgi:protein MpaA